MHITYGEAKKILSPYASVAGSCDPQKIELFVMEVMQYLLYSGETGSLRKFTFHAKNGCFTLPYELEVPLKVKVGEQVGQVWSKWFEYHSDLNMGECSPAQTALYEEANTFPTVYDLPSCGAKVAALATCIESPDAHVIVKGLDMTGREVYTVHKGEKIHGEYLSLQKGKANTTNVLFGVITEISKSKTNGYVNLLWVNENLTQRGFLADYDPYEQNPGYRKVRILIPCPSLTKVSVLGRIRLKRYYADEDRIPFDNIRALTLAAQAVNSERNNQNDTAKYKNDQLQVTITNEATYKNVNTGIPIDTFRPTSMGSIPKLFRRGGSWLRGRR